MARQVQWKNAKGDLLTLYVRDVRENQNGEPCYVVSKVADSPATFLVPQASVEPVFK